MTNMKQELVRLSQPYQSACWTKISAPASEVAPRVSTARDTYPVIAMAASGGGGDGSFGVQIMKDKEGQVIAQDRPTSQDFSMPETSIKTGDVDFILPLNEIAPKLIQLVAAGGGVPSQKTQRRSKRRGRRVPAPAKIVTRHYSARAKAATILRKK